MVFDALILMGQNKIRIACFVDFILILYYFIDIQRKSLLKVLLFLGLLKKVAI